MVVPNILYALILPLSVISVIQFSIVAYLNPHTISVSLHPSSLKRCSTSRKPNSRRFFLITLLIPSAPKLSALPIPHCDSVWYHSHLPHYKHVGRCYRLFPGYYTSKRILSTSQRHGKSHSIAPFLPQPTFILAFICFRAHLVTFWGHTIRAINRQAMTVPAASRWPFFSLFPSRH